jgi:hypothetical protein
MMNELAELVASFSTVHEHARLGQTRALTPARAEDELALNALTELASPHSFLLVLDYRTPLDPLRPTNTAEVQQEK